MGCKIKTYLCAFNLWDVVENEKEPPHLPANSTVNQMKNYTEEKAKRFKAKSCIESQVFEEIFIRKIICEKKKKPETCSNMNSKVVTKQGRCNY